MSCLKVMLNNNAAQALQFYLVKIQDGVGSCIHFTAADNSLSPPPHTIDTERCDLKTIIPVRLGLKLISCKVRVLAEIQYE
mmetsp:Transcript_23101/g.56441  ORF Transcript_23101/g.56441 Transcript_23101/m.56441 type:complete len:81 (-) Transcript_23101:201-443(-)